MLVMMMMMNIMISIQISICAEKRKILTVVEGRKGKRTGQRGEAAPKGKEREEGMENKNGRQGGRDGERR